MICIWAITYSKWMNQMSVFMPFLFCSCNFLSDATQAPAVFIYSWWRHQMEAFSALLVFVRGIHRSPLNSSNKGQWRGALIFSLICVWIKGWVNNREADNLRRYRAHYDVSVMYRAPAAYLLLFYSIFSQNLNTRTLHYIIVMLSMRWLLTERVWLWRKVFWQHIRCITGATWRSDCPKVARGKSQCFSRITTVVITSWEVRVGVICVVTHTLSSTPKTEFENAPRSVRNQRRVVPIRQPVSIWPLVEVSMMDVKHGPGKQYKRCSFSMGDILHTLFWNALFQTKCVYLRRNFTEFVTKVSVCDILRDAINGQVIGNHNVTHAVFTSMLQVYLTGTGTQSKNDYCSIIDSRYIAVIYDTLMHTA